VLHLSRQRGTQAELLVAYRFLEAGLPVSWPLLPCAYDLVVDTGERLVRVQVKQAHQAQTPTGMPGHWRVRLTKRRTDGADRAIAVTAVDYLCVICGGPEEILVIPAAACASQQDGRWLRAQLQVGPESKYRVFLNRFVLGDGARDQIVGAAVPPLRKPGAWGPRPPRRELGQRKVYRRLTPDVIAQIRQMPVQWYRRDPGEGRIPVDDVARQFDVCPETLRRLVLRAERLDLQRPHP
jgi:PD-(D/E)XK endonuclease